MPPPTVQQALQAVQQARKDIAELQQQPRSKASTAHIAKVLTNIEAQQTLEQQRLTKIYQGARR